MDIVEGFPRVNGKSVVLTVVDHFSKYAHFIVLDHPYTTTCGVGVLRHHCSAPQDSQFHSQRQTPRLHKQILV
jgi:hypothetical protein